MVENSHGTAVQGVIGLIPGCSCLPVGAFSSKVGLCYCLLPVRWIVGDDLAINQTIIYVPSTARPDRKLAVGEP